MSKEIKTIENNPLQNIINNLISDVSNVSNYEITNKNNKLTVKFDSIDGNGRNILTFEKQGGYQHSTMTQSIKLPLEERRELVKSLHSQGKKQSEIANITMYSQKTISNDLAALKLKK